MDLLKSTLLVALIIGISGCYNAKVTTGLEPSAKVYEKSFASSWIYGLVPPKTVEATEKCNNGVAMVETKLSFVNMLVGNLTLGIYTPMYIKVTCASGTASEQLEDGNYPVLTRSTDDITKDFQRASQKAVETQQPVFLKVR